MPLIKTGPLEKKLIEHFLILKSDFLNQLVICVEEDRLEDQLVLYACKSKVNRFGRFPKQILVPKNTHKGVSEG